MQTHIVTLHLAGQQRNHEPPSSGGVRLVCKSFDAHSFLCSRSLQHLNITASLRTAALLPYLPALKTVVCSEKCVPFSRFLSRILQTHPMPQLVALTLHCHLLEEVPALMAVVAACSTQLTELSIGISFERGGRKQTAEAIPIPSFHFSRAYASCHSSSRGGI